MHTLIYTCMHEKERKRERERARRSGGERSHGIVKESTMTGTREVEREDEIPTCLEAYRVASPITVQCVAVCCSVLQCVAVCHSVLYCAAVCCSVLQCAAVCCNLLRLVCSDNVQ